MSDASLYRPTLRKAWQIAWRFKALWVLGFFATLLSSGGEYEIITRFFYDRGSSGGFFSGIAGAFSSGIASGLQGGGSLWQNMTAALTSTPAATIAGVLVLALIAVVAIFFIWLGVTSQIALIRNVSVINQNKKTTINEGFDYGVKNFWPVFWSNVLLKLVILVVFGIFGWIATLLTSGLWQTAAYILIFVAFVIVTLLASALPKLQMLYIIIDKQRFWQALGSSWELFKRNWLILIELAAILLVVYIIGMFVTAFASMVLTAVPLFVIPLYFPAIAPIAAYIILIACMVLMVAIIVLVAAIVTTYQWTAWTVLFNRIDNNEERSGITRFAGQIANVANFNRN